MIYYYSLDIPTTTRILEIRKKTPQYFSELCTGRLLSLIQKIFSQTLYTLFYSNLLEVLNLVFRIPLDKDLYHFWLIYFFHADIFKSSILSGQLSIFSISKSPCSNALNSSQVLTSTKWNYFQHEAHFLITQNNNIPLFKRAIPLKNES